MNINQFISIKLAGWGKLSIETNPLHIDETQMFAAGTTSPFIAIKVILI
jgi:hypothetical protein